MLAALTTDTHFGYGRATQNHHTKRLRKLKVEMDKVGSKLLLHTGDWALCRQRQLYRTLQMFREILGPDIVIAACLGNHDYWSAVDDWTMSDGIRYSFADLFRIHEEWFKEFDIRYLNGRTTPLMVEDVAIVGFDGWYADPKIHSRTNDMSWMPKQMGEGYERYVDGHDLMFKRAHKSFGDAFYMMDYGTPRKVIGLSHFPLLEGTHNGNPQWLEHMADMCDIVCFGHSHEQIVGQPVGFDSLMYNAGSDYGNIRTLFIEV